MQTQNKSHHCSINTVLTMLAVIPEIRLHIAKNVNQSSAFKAIFHVFYFSYWDNESQQKFVHEVQLDPHGLHRWQKYGYEVVEIWKHIAERLCLDLICTTVSKSDLHQSWTSLY
ncbi:unnamed protein product, partial [Mesorhabditis belari]|uniref:Uncharacterized protein n=1 Tax=Mesorhabditis belari TaxID=2138241 RepID=A0AAF3E924_9BILA